MAASTCPAMPSGWPGSPASPARPRRPPCTMDACHRAQRRPLHGAARAGGRRGPVRAPPLGRPAAERAGWRSICRPALGSATTPGSRAAPSATAWRPSPRPRAAPWSPSTPTRSTRSGPIARRAPIAPVRRHDERYAGEADAAKRERIAAEVGKKGADAAPADRRRLDRLAAQRARRRHRLQPAGAELCPAVQRRHLPLVRRSAQAAARA